MASMCALPYQSCPSMMGVYYEWPRCKHLLLNLGCQSCNPHRRNFLQLFVFPRAVVVGQNNFNLSSFSVLKQSGISFNMESFEVRLTIRLVKKIFESEKLNGSVYRLSDVVGLFVIFVVSLPVVVRVVAGGGAFEDPALSANLTFDGVASLMQKRVS